MVELNLDKQLLSMYRVFKCLPDLIVQFFSVHFLIVDIGKHGSFWFISFSSKLCGRLFSSMVMNIIMKLRNLKSEQGLSHHKNC